MMTYFLQYLGQVDVLDPKGMRVIREAIDRLKVRVYTVLGGGCVCVCVGGGGPCIGWAWCNVYVCGRGLCVRESLECTQLNS